MQRDLVALACILIFLALVALVIKTVRRRRTLAIAPHGLPAIETLTGQVIGSFGASYVSTVLADKPLERVMSHGLMYRGNAEITIHTDGLAVARRGEVSFAIPSDSLIEIGRSSASIDRGVESAGLLAISWTLGSTAVTSNFRVRSEDDTPTLFESIQNLRNEGHTP